MKRKKEIFKKSLVRVLKPVNNEDGCYERKKRLEKEEEEKRRSREKNSEKDEKETNWVAYETRRKRK